MERKIKSYKIKSRRFTNVIIAVFDDGTSGEVFEYYPDEISFDEQELIGLTEDEAYNVKTKKDLAYLQS